MSMHDFYVLDGHTPVPETNPQKWSEFFENPDNRRVAMTKIKDVAISTVFLGLDHSFNPGDKPLLFETMVFGGELNEEQRRCSTWEEAERMHARMVAEVKETL